MCARKVSAPWPHPSNGHIAVLRLRDDDRWRQFASIARQSSPGESDTRLRQCDSDGAQLPLCLRLLSLFA